MTRSIAALLWQPDLLPAPSLAHAQVPGTPTFSKHIAPIFQEKCEACHRPDSIAPMSLRTFQESAAVGALDQGARRSAADAAVAHRQDGRHPGVQERSLAHRRSDRHDPEVGRSRRARGRSEGHAAGQGVAGRPGVDLRGDVRPEGTRPDHPLDAVDAEAGANDTWWKPMVDTGLTEPRWVRAIEVRPGTVKGRKITHHANTDLFRSTR